MTGFNPNQFENAPSRINLNNKFSELSNKYGPPDRITEEAKSNNFSTEEQPGWGSSNNQIPKRISSSLFKKKPVPEININLK